MYRQLVLTAVLCALPAMGMAHHPHKGSDADGIRHAMMATWDKPDARLTVEPVVVSGSHAIAGWIQADRGGRALLRRDHDKWVVVACSGEGLKDVSLLRQAGLSAGAARELVRALAAAEATLPAEQVKKYALFDGWLKVEGAHHAPAHKHKEH
jgi:hypothetical protein